MSRDRFVVLGLGQVGSGWFRDVARWSTTGSLPIEVVKTVSLEEVRSRLRSGRTFSALLVDDGVPGLERDLFDLAGSVDCAVLVVTTRNSHSWEELGAAATLPPDLDPHLLVQVLHQVARPIGSESGPVADRLDPDAGTASGDQVGQLVTVTGSGGTGSSTVAIALAQHAADRDSAAVCLADLARRADQAMLHGTPDIVPGVQELVDAHRLGAPDPVEIRSLTWQIAPRRYDLLLGLRRPQDWTSLRPRAVAAAIEGLRRTYELTIADVDADLEGEQATGSLDVEERHALARTAVHGADLVVVVGGADMKGVHSLQRVVRDVIDIGVEPRRILPVLNRAPRSPKARAELARAVASLSVTSTAPTPRRGSDPQPGTPGPIFLPERRHLDLVHRDVARLPEAWIRPLGAAVLGLLDRATPGTRPVEPEPVLLRAGALGAWTDDDEELG